MSKEYVIASVDDLQDGQMKEIEVRGRKLLLVRTNGQYHALGHTCPHQGAPLADGTMLDHHIRCPWHQSVFDARNGNLLEPPALDALPHLDLRIDGRKVLVTLPDELPESRLPRMADPDPAADPRVFVILGSGAAGMAAGETLRQAGYRGRIIMITREAHPPYDRTTLSKQYLAKADVKKPFVRPADFYTEHGIELLANFQVSEVDVIGKMITREDGYHMRYDKLLLASGALPRRLNVPGENLPGVQYLRSLEDCEQIRGRVVKGGKAVVIGGSFIAMEAGACLAQRGMSVTVVAQGNVPFERTLGEEIGRMYQAVHEEHGTRFKMGQKAARFDGEDKLKAVVLESGEKLPADLAVVGVGVQPVTNYLHGLDTNPDDSVDTDFHLGAAEDVYAAGDIARFPDWRTGQLVRIEHWRLAEQHGRYAALNMAGHFVEFRGVPFFWTSQHRVIVQYVGHAEEWDEIVFDGETDQRKFIAYYVKDGRVLALAGCNREREMAIAAELLKAETMPAVQTMRTILAQAEAQVHA